jgi:large subunit ribosomal protein L10
MPKTKLAKQEILNQLVEKIRKSNSVVFANYSKVTVAESEELRKGLKSDNGEFYVSKKTLIDLALKQCNLSGVNIRDFDGQIALILSYKDQIAPVKTIDAFRKNNEEKIKFLGGFLDNIFINSMAVEQFAGLPSREILIAKIVGSINAPVSGFVNVLAGNLRSLMNALKAIEEQKAQLN